MLVSSGYFNSPETLLLIMIQSGCMVFLLLDRIRMKKRLRKNKLGIRRQMARDFEEVP